MVGGTLAAGAVLGMAIATVPLAPAFAVAVPLCGDPAHAIRLPIGDDHRQRGDCAGGCHASCCRRDSADGDEGEE